MQIYHKRLAATSTRERFQLHSVVSLISIIYHKILVISFFCHLLVSFHDRSIHLAPLFDVNTQIIINAQNFEFCSNLHKQVCRII